VPVLLAASNIPVLADHPLEALGLDDLARHRARDEVGVHDVRARGDLVAQLLDVRSACHLIRVCHLIIRVIGIPGPCHLRP
jgi:hypothetical protein